MNPHSSNFIPRPDEWTPRSPILGITAARFATYGAVFGNKWYQTDRDTTPLQWAKRLWQTHVDTINRLQATFDAECENPVYSLAFPSSHTFDDRFFRQHAPRVRSILCPPFDATVPQLAQPCHRWFCPHCRGRRVAHVFRHLQRTVRRVRQMGREPRLWLSLDVQVRVCSPSRGLGGQFPGRWYPESDPDMLTRLFEPELLAHDEAGGVPFPGFLPNWLDPQLLHRPRPDSPRLSDAAMRRLYPVLTFDGYHQLSPLPIAAAAVFRTPWPVRVHRDLHGDESFESPYGWVLRKTCVAVVVLPQSGRGRPRKWQSHRDRMIQTGLMPASHPADHEDGMYWPMVRPPERREMVSEQVDDRQLSRWVTRAGAYPGWVPRLAGHEDPAVRWQVILAIVAFHRRRFVAYLRPTPSLAQAFRKWDRESAREGGSPLCE